jgi:hypothetical protein
VALIVGFITSPVLARALAFGLDGQVAAFILETDRWNAGVALMQAQSPQAWRVLMGAGKLTADNSAALRACREAAAKAKKEQHCTVIAPVP